MRCEPIMVWFLCPYCGREFSRPWAKCHVARVHFCSMTCGGRFLGLKGSGGTGRRSLEERFWDKVLKTESCWLWQGSCNERSGHGRISAGPPHKHGLRVHRLSWEMHHGPIPDGLYVLHACPGGDRPNCVNPAHLWLGTHDENMADMGRRGNVRRGEAHMWAKLTEPDVREIRSLAATGGWSQTQLAARFNVSQSAIGFVLRGETWARLE